MRENITKLDSFIEIAPDVGTIVEATPEEEETTIDIVQIVGVPLLDVCKACLQRKARVEPRMANAQRLTVIWFNVIISVLIK